MPLIGTAGTATTMAAVALKLTTYDPDKVTGLRLEPERVAELRDTMLAATTAQRRETPGVEPQRADVIAAGIAIYARALDPNPRARDDHVRSRDPLGPRLRASGY